MTALISEVLIRRNMHSQVNRSIAMKWETPAAVELRFGMEITMYVANR
jgi:coenzyme PQQ precursor peptide PqqA